MASLLTLNYQRLLKFPLLCRDNLQGRMYMYLSSLPNHDGEIFTEVFKNFLRGFYNLAVVSP